jgi:hypothetical protein
MQQCSKIIAEILCGAIDLLLKTVKYLKHLIIIIFSNSQTLRK